MERGSGSSVCRINFNFPMLKKNTISVAKDVTSDAGTLGDPDFKFQVLKANDNGSKPAEDTLFIGPDTEYKVYNVNNTLLRTARTDANGVFTLKEGERAEFSNIEENSGEATTTASNKIVLDSVEFTGVESPVKDCSDGSTQFRFVNDIDKAKLADLEISKQVNAYSGGIH